MLRKFIESASPFLKSSSTIENDSCYRCHGGILESFIVTASSVFQPPNGKTELCNKCLSDLSLATLTDDERWFLRECGITEVEIEKYCQKISVQDFISDFKSNLFKLKRFKKNKSFELGKLFYYHNKKLEPSEYLLHFQKWLSSYVRMYDECTKVKCKVVLDKNGKNDRECQQFLHDVIGGKRSVSSILHEYNKNSQKKRKLKYFDEASDKDRAHENNIEVIDLTSENIEIDEIKENNSQLIKRCSIFLTKLDQTKAHTLSQRSSSSSSRNIPLRNKEQCSDISKHKSSQKKRKLKGSKEDITTRNKKYVKVRHFIHEEIKIDKDEESYYNFENSFLEKVNEISKCSGAPPGAQNYNQRLSFIRSGGKSSVSPNKDISSVEQKEAIQEKINQASSQKNITDKNKEDTKSLVGLLINDFNATNLTEILPKNIDIESKHYFLNIIVFKRNVIVSTLWLEHESLPLIIDDRNVTLNANNFKVILGNEMLFPDFCKVLIDFKKVMLGDTQRLSLNDCLSCLSLVDFNKVREYVEKEFAPKIPDIVPKIRAFLDSYYGKQQHAKFPPKINKNRCTGDVSRPTEHNTLGQRNIDVDASGNESQSISDSDSDSVIDIGESCADIISDYWKHQSYLNEKLIEKEGKDEPDEEVEEKSISEVFVPSELIPECLNDFNLDDSSDGNNTNVINTIQNGENSGLLSFFDQQLREFEQQGEPSERLPFLENLLNDIEQVCDIHGNFEPDQFRNFELDDRIFDFPLPQPRQQEYSELEDEIYDLLPNHSRHLGNSESENEIFDLLSSQTPQSESSEPSSSLPATPDSALSNHNYSRTADSCLFSAQSIHSGDSSISKGTDGEINKDETSRLISSFLKDELVGVNVSVDDEDEEDLAKKNNLIIDSQESSLPSMPQDQEKESFSKKQNFTSRLTKTSLQKDIPSSLVHSVSSMPNTVNMFRENKYSYQASPNAQTTRSFETGNEIFALISNLNLDGYDNDNKEAEYSKVIGADDELDSVNVSVHDEDEEDITKKDATSNPQMTRNFETGNELFALISSLNLDGYGSDNKEVVGADANKNDVENDAQEIELSEDKAKASDENDDEKNTHIDEDNENKDEGEGEDEQDDEYVIVEDDDEQDIDEEDSPKEHNT